MITVYPYKKLGHANYGWLDARYHFSFANYYDPGRVGFGALRVINDDIVKAGAGFDTHPHRDMEIITYVRKGGITHKDSNGNEGRTAAGDVQVMTAGKGIFHSEFNLESEDTNLYQIWIEPQKKGLPPAWGSNVFPKEPVTNALPLLVSGDPGAPLHINQDARIYGGRLSQGTELTHKIQGQAYILASDGEMQIGSHTITKGDGAEVTSLPELKISAKTDSEILIIEVPA